MINWISLRGGCLFHYDWLCKGFVRYYHQSIDKSNFIGFRLIKTIKK